MESNSDEVKSQIIGVVGGTGKLGKAIAGRLVLAGCRVVIGSRHVENAVAAATELGREAHVSGADNLAAATAADIVIVTVPFAAQEQTLREIADAVRGKIVIDTTVPLMPPKVSRVSLPPEGSAASRAQAVLGADVKLVAAFHNVAAEKLARNAPVDCDVLVFGDDASARDAGVAIARLCGLRGLHGGALANAVAAEAMTSVLIFINRQYRSEGSGIRITAIEAEV